MGREIRYGLASAIQDGSITGAKIAAGAIDNSKVAANAAIVTSKLSGNVFGGTGADGALAISSGTTTIDLAGAQYVVKNYTSISITGTGALAFINPHASGTIVTLKSQGAVVLTSSATALIDTRGIGANSAVEGSGMIVRGTQGSGATGGVQWSPLHSASVMIAQKALYVACGSGGGNGAAGSGGGTSGPGGRGGGGLLIECAGALNFTGTINTSGSAGTAGTGGDGAGGGGGAAGLCVILYGTLTANTGTITATGGAGGNGGTPSSGNGTGGGGAGGLSGTGRTGATGAGAVGNGAGAGSSGAGSLGGGPWSGGAATASIGGLVFANTDFI